MDKRTLLVIVSASILRLTLFTFFPTLSTLLGGRVEISTPVTSYKRLQEGLFLYTHGLSPYDGGVYHQAPILLALFSILPKGEWAVNALYVAADVASALALVGVSNSGVATVARLHTSWRRGAEWPAWAVAAAYVHPGRKGEALRKPEQRG